MKTPRRQIVKKYTHAFLRTYNSQFIPADRESVSCYLSFLHEHHQITFFAYHAALDAGNKIELFMRAFDESCISRMQMRQALEKLITILVYHERILLLPEILKLIIVRFYAAIGYQHALISTSHAINEQEQQEIIESFKALADKNIDAEFSVDPQLIAGLRIISQDYLWESSIAQKIKVLLNR
jgi:F0F1-type ATP synthase delta subunit